MRTDERATASEVRRHTDLRIPVLGDTVGAMRYEPVGVEAPRPTLLMYVPYPKDDLITYGAYDPLNRYLAHHGYDVVVADMVGTGSSTGWVDEMFRRREGEEGAAIVEWLAEQAWSTGRVGMFGKSYGGITALDAAAQRPDHLEAIVPIHTPYEGFRNAYTNGGLFELLTIGMDWLTLMQALAPKPPSVHDTEADWVEVWTDRLEHLPDRDPWLVQFLEREPHDGYWADKDIPVGDIDVPMLAVGGWRDPYTTDTVRFFEAVDAPKRLLLGPWRHAMPHRGRESSIDFRRQVRDWFDHYLKDVDNGVPDEPTVQYWTERDGGGQVDGGVWRGRDDWPDADRDGDESVAFALSPDGLVPADSFESGELEVDYDVDYTVGIHAIDPYGAAVEPGDTSADDTRSLAFESEPLENPLELTGTGRVGLRLEADDPDPTVSVRLMDVAPDGTARLVTHGTMRAQCRTGVRSPTPLEPGEEYDLDVELEPKSHVFEAGHRVRVAVAGGFFPEVMPAGDAETLTVRSSPAEPSRVDLPGGFRPDLGFDDAIEMAGPDETIPAESQFVTHSDASWETARERTTDRVRATSESRFEADLPHVDLSRASRFEASIEADDPDSLVARNELELALGYPDEAVTVTARSRFGRDYAALTTTVEVDDRTVFEERWLG